MSNHMPHNPSNLSPSEPEKADAFNKWHEDTDELSPDDLHHRCYLFTLNDMRAAFLAGQRTEREKLVDPLASREPKGAQ